MTAKYLAILTNQGAARLANAAALGTKLNLTQMAVGDANGTLPTPDPAQTKLINQKRIAPLNLLTVDPANTSQIIAEQIIPENEGGFWIREIGLYDDDGILIAVANCPETYKPQLQEGSGRTQTIRMILIVSSTSSITLKIDPSVVLATRKYADDKAIELKLYVDDLMSKHLAAADPHSQYATKDSPTFTGKPKAPTPPVVANDTQVATAGFVQAVIAALVSGELANKQPLDKTLTDLSGKDVAAILEYLGLGEAAKRNVGTGANQIPDMGSFTLSVSGTGYQKLPSGFILQWGSIGSIGTPGIAQDVVTHFPIAFPNRCLRVLVSQDYTPDSGAVGYIACAGFSSDPVKFISRASTPGLGASFLALGC
ncbi:phage tail protein [Escherichia coli]|nr:phage tail protein [Escherichia coli]